MQPLTLMLFSCSLPPFSCFYLAYHMCSPSQSWTIPGNCLSDVWTSTVLGQSSFFFFFNISWIQQKKSLPKRKHNILNKISFFSKIKKRCMKLSSIIDTDVKNACKIRKLEWMYTLCLNIHQEKKMIKSMFFKWEKTKIIIIRKKKKKKKKTCLFSLCSNLEATQKYSLF